MTHGLFQQLELEFVQTMLDIHISLQEASPNDWLVLIMQGWRSVNGRLLLEYLLFIQNIHILSQNIELARLVVVIGGQLVVLMLLTGSFGRLVPDSIMPQITCMLHWTLIHTPKNTNRLIKHWAWNFFFCRFSSNWILLYFPLFVRSSVPVSQAWHLTFLTYIKA